MVAPNGNRVKDGRSRLSRRARAAVALGGLVGALAGACAPDAAAGRSSSRSSAIIGGTADTTHDAVMALLQRQTPTTVYGCSGTTIAQAGTSAFLLTAAHCVVLHDAMDEIIQPLALASPSVMTVVPGPDWQTNHALGHEYMVAAIAIAPGYDGTSESPNDMAIVRYVTGMPSLPVISVLEAADDALVAGATLTLVGYGVTVVGTQNSVRQTVDRPIDSLTAQHLFYLQNDIKGQCSGDSGGPALTRVGGVERVAGVISFDVELPNMGVTCTLEGASVRVSSLASFIHSIIGAGGSPDAGASPDAGLPTDAARVPDAGSGNDAGSPSDAQKAPSCGKLTDPRPACAACIASRCCMEAAICGADPLCLGCGANPLSTCQLYPPSAILTSCLATCPGNPCTVPLDGGGSARDAAITDARPTDTAGRGDAADMMDAGAVGRDAVADGARPPGDAAGPDAPPSPEARERTDASPGPDARADADAASLATGSGCSCAVGGPSESIWGALLSLLALRRGRRRRQLVVRRGPS